jgi:hypothetical protein
VSGSPEPPPEVVELAQRRAAARTARDFEAADGLRAQVRDLGWEVTDTPEGSALALLQPYPVHRSLADLPDLPDQSERTDVTARECSVGLLVEGWPDDVRTCIEALLLHLRADVVVLALDLGNVDGAGDVLHELALAHPGRIEEWHVAATPDQAGWGPARSALLRLDPASIHVVMDVSTVLDGDAITLLLAGFGDSADPYTVAVGWRGALVDVEDGWRSVSDARPGEVDVLLSYLFAVDRQAALASPPHPKARFYRNADLEWSLALRAAGGHLYVTNEDLPCHQQRHHGYEDSDPDYRDRESRRTYDRLLQRFRAHPEILAPRTA